MTIGSIQSGSTFTPVCTTTEARVAMLVLQNEDQQQEIEHEGVALARERFIEQSKAEVAAMREEAHDLLSGALIQTGVVLTGAAVQGYALSKEAKACQAVAVATPGSKAAQNALDNAKMWETIRGIGASASNGLAPALEKALGESPVANDRADAKQAATAAQQAEWELNDRKDALERSRGDQQQAVDWLSQLVDKDAASMSAVLSNMA